MRRFKAPSPAMVVALLALFVALGGSGYAARSVTQSSPTTAQIIAIVRSVAPTLKVAGFAPLLSKHTESGMFAGADGYSNSDGYVAAWINYPRPLPAPIADSNIIDVHGTSALHCPGPGHAAPGYLCLYNTDQAFLSGSPTFFSDDGQAFPASMGTQGVVLYWWVTAGDAFVGGTWAVTAP